MKTAFVALALALVVLPSLVQARPQRALTDHQRVKILQARVAALEAHASKHAWPGLTDAEKSALVAVLTTLPKETKFDIICNDAGCNELAMDIDDAMERAGLESVLDRLMSPLGYGIAVQVNPFDRAMAECAAAALKKATHGRLDVPVMESPKGTTPPGYAMITIGKYKAPAAAR
jgi:hypothetical protein